MDLKQIYKKFKRKYPHGCLSIIFYSPCMGRFDWKLINTPHMSGYSEHCGLVCFKTTKELIQEFKNLFGINIIERNGQNV